jgi:heavy metal sensor kinase
MALLPTSVRTRLTLWYTVALALPLVAFAVVSYLIFSATLHDRTDAFIQDALSVFAGELLVERSRNATLGTAVRTTVAEVRFQELDIVVRDADGELVGMSAPRSGTRPAGEPPIDAISAVSEAGAAAAVSPDTTVRALTLRTSTGPYRVVVRPLSIDASTYSLAGVYPLAEVHETLAAIRRLFLIAIPLLILAAGTGGSFLARRSFRPVTRMAERAAEIGASTLHERLPVVTRDELGTLGAVLNDLLDRLERSFEQQRRFMADASHELRTPTAIVRTESEVTLSRQRRTEAEYRASMNIVQDAARRLTRIVDDIFLLARADAGHLVMNTGPLYLDELVRDTVQGVRPIADSHGVRIEIIETAESPLVGDTDLLGRLVLNLLDNAIKYSPDGSAIDVALEARDDAYELSVVDHGVGIPAEAAEQIFQRFYRVDTARSRHDRTLTSGAGLGLSICRRIAEMHDGTVTLAGSRPGRTEFRVRLPAAHVPGPVTTAPA